MSCQYGRRIYLSVDNLPAEFSFQPALARSWHGRGLSFGPSRLGLSHLFDMLFRMTADGVELFSYDERIEAVQFPERALANDMLGLRAGAVMVGAERCAKTIGRLPGPCKWLAPLRTCHANVRGLSFSTADNARRSPHECKESRVTLAGMALGEGHGFSNSSASRLFAASIICRRAGVSCSE